MLAASALTYVYPAADAWDARDAGFRLRSPPFQVAAGRSLALVGPSGCGKSTLLSLLSGERVPDEGSIHFGELRIDALDDRARRRFRITTVGLVFQEFRLLEYLTVLDNILLPCRLHPALPLDAAMRRRARELADRLGIGQLLRRRPERLSHGERQRVAAARALLARPRLLLADEPTGNLDPSAKERLLDEFLALAREEAASVVVATHDHGLLARYDAVLDLAAPAIEVASA